MIGCTPTSCENCIPTFYKNQNGQDQMSNKYFYCKYLKKMFYSGTMTAHLPRHTRSC